MIQVHCLGDSNTVGVGASSPSRTYPACLQRLLNRRAGVEAYGVTVQAVNGTGFCVPDTDRVATWVADTPVDVCVLAFITVDAFFDVGVELTVSAAVARYGQAIERGLRPLVVLSPSTQALATTYNQAVAGALPLEALVSVCGLDVETDYCDGIHLNDSGLLKLADAVARVVMA